MKKKYFVGFCVGILIVFVGGFMSGLSIGRIGYEPKSTQQVVALNGPVYTSGNIRAGFDNVAGVLIFEGEGEVKDFWPFTLENFHKIHTIVFRDGITSIADDEFYGLPNLETVIFEGYIERVGIGAFRDCSRLRTVWFERIEGCKKIDAFAFEDCSRLRVVSVNSSCEIGEGAFLGTPIQPTVDSEMAEIPYYKGDMP